MALRVAGIDKWAAGIRHRMANDPGRQDLDDHILCNGFLFLDEYLEDILIGAQSGTIIELTKTPGRRKDTCKKDRVAITASVKTLQSSEKENMPILQSPTRAKKAPTSFQKALLKASRENQPETFSQIPDDFKSESQNPFHQDNFAVKHMDDDDDEEEAVTVLVTPPSTRLDCTESKESTLLPSFSTSGLPKPLDAGVASSTSNPTIVNPGVELSVIVEGDENEMSRGSLTSTRLIGPVIRDKEVSSHILADSNNPNGDMESVTVSHKLNTNDDEDDTQAFPSALDRTFNDSEPTSTASSFPIDPYARDYETYELPQVVAEHTLAEPSHPHSPLAPTLIRKASIPVLPSLPGPSPLRKSTRDSVVGGPPAGNARCSATTGTVASTRSSWLNKARDVTAKRASFVSGVKRKSGDLTGETDYAIATEAHIRVTKVAKTRADGGVTDAPSETEKSQGKLAIQPFKAIILSKHKEQPHEPPVAHVATPDGNSEGMMNILKRTVEGLGARVGKSMGKSLGGAAATAAAAEAKAAAEARLAQREAKGSDGTRQGRLSVSDLVGAFESGEVGKSNGQESSGPKSKAPPPSAPLAPHVTPGSRASISTTPPDSPPVTRAQVSFTPGHTTHTIPKFTVQRTITQEPSFGLPESQQSQPSTQSTYVSSIFDDHSTWPHSSLGTDYTASQGFSQPRDYESVHDLEPSDSSRETRKGQSQANLATLQDVITSPQTRQAKVSLSVAPQGSISRLRDSSEPCDDMGSGEATGVSGSGSSDAAEQKLKTGTSQGNSINSTQSGLVAGASTLLSKVMGSGVSSALSSSKRSKPEPVKSIQLAAAAAKKQQEEADKKAARLREMDKRRAAIASRKADQDAIERTKQQGDRHKREREDAPEKIAKTTVKKGEEEVTKKRKVVVEIEKKPQNKKALKDKELGSSRIGKPTLNSSLSQSQLASSGSSKMFKPPPASTSQPSIKLVGSNQGEPKPVALPKAGRSNGLEDIRQPSQTLHAQMQARVQAQLLQTRQEEPLVPSESIELPDIKSEYSNSDDEDRPRTFDPPDWAQSPVLGLALQSQSRLNPDDIFGPVKPLKMEEIFTTRHSRFRARTSSANWTGTDELTTDEQRQYAKRMGYLD